MRETTKNAACCACPFMEHLEELRSRIIRALAGFGVAFLLCLCVCVDRLWNDRPGARPGDALKKIGKGSG